MEINTSANMRSDIQEIMNRIREFSQKNTTNQALPTEPVAAEKGGFSQMLSQAESYVDQVSAAQSSSEEVNKAWLTGTGNVSVAQVVVAAEKSRLAMEGLVTVRNKLLESYREIMNMQV